MKTKTSSSVSTATSTRLSPDRGASASEAAHDANLVRQFNEGNEAAFLEIMERYREKTYRIARAVLRNHGDAEEITQDTFVRAHRGLARFRGDSSLATWLHSIAINLSRNRYWFNYRRRQHATVSLDSPLRYDSASTFSDLLAAESASPAHEAVSTEFSGLIEVCMARLAPAHREILTLRNILHNSYEEIGTKLGITVGTVKSRIARARFNVRGILSEMCPEFARESGLGEWFEPVRVAGLLAVA